MLRTYNSFCLFYGHKDNKHLCHITAEVVENLGTEYGQYGDIINC